MTLRHIIYTPSDVFEYAGYPTIEVGIGDGPIELSTTEAALHLDAAQATFRLRRPLLTLDGVGSSDDSPPGILELATVMRSKGWKIISKTSGHVFPNFMTQCDYPVAFVGNDPWANFFVKELHYSPQPGEEFKEPIVGSNNVNSYKVFLPPPKAMPISIISFLKSAVWDWSVRPASDIPYAVNCAQ